MSIMHLPANTSPERSPSLLGRHRPAMTRRAELARFADEARRARQVSRRGRRPLGFFVLGVILILIFLFIFIIYPKAEITLLLASEPLKANLEIKLDAKINKILPGLAILPAQTIVFSFKKPSQDYEIKGEVDKKLNGKLAKGQVLLPELVYYEEKEGEINVMALVFKQKEMAELLAFKLSQMVANNKELMPRPNDILQYNVKTFKPIEQQAVIEAELTRTIIPKLDLVELSQQLANQPISQAEKQLKGLAGVKEVKIRLTGGWFKKMPLISQRIKLKLDTF